MVKVKVEFMEVEVLKLGEVMEIIFLFLGMALIIVFIRLLV